MHKTIRLAVAILPVTSVASAPPTPVPVWWETRPEFVIKDQAECATLWRTWKPVMPERGEVLTVTMTSKDGSRRDAATVAEWMAAMDRGALAMSTVDLAMQSWFMDGALRFSTIALLQPSRHSAFAGRPFDRYCLLLLSMFREREAALLKRPQEAHHLTFTIGDHEVTAVDTVLEPTIQEKFQWDETATVVARGDLNGDGWEDLVVSTAQHSLDGSGSSRGSEAFTQVGDGHLLPLTPLLPPRLLSDQEAAERRVAIASSFGLPQDRELVLQGAFTRHDQRPKPVEWRIRLQNGFIRGTCLRQGEAPVPIEGSLGPSGDLLVWEYGAGEVGTGEFHLKWRRRGDRMLLKGWWSDSQSTTSVDLSGALPEAGPDAGAPDPKAPADPPERAQAPSPISQRR